MNVEAIQLFVETAQRGSFAVVARGRGVAPSSVSRAVAELEAELAVRLFQRTTRALCLTEAGRAYLGRVAPLLEELALAREHAHELKSSPRGRLRIAVVHSFAQLYLARWLPGFLARYPDLDVDLVLDGAYTDLVGEKIDVAIRLGPPELSTAISRKLCAMPRAIVASPARLAGRRIKPADLAREPCLLFPHAGFAPTWRLRDGRGRVTEVAPRPRVVAADGLVLRDLCEQGEGFGLFPRWLCAAELAAGTLVDVFPKHEVTATEFGATISVLYASRSYLPLKVRAFVDFLGEVFRDGAPWERQPVGGGAGR